MQVQAKAHPMATLLVGANNVMSSKDEALHALKRIATLDDKSAGNTLALETLALAKGQARPWSALAARIFDLTVEGRAFYVKALANDVKAVKAAVVADTECSTKAAGKLMRTAGVRISQCKRIAQAIDAGMTKETVVVAWLPKREHTETAYAAQVADTVQYFGDYIGFDLIADVANKFLPSSGKGRPKLAWIAKMAKWLEQNPAEEDDVVAGKQYDAIVKLVNTL